MIAKSILQLAKASDFLAYRLCKNEYFGYFYKQNNKLFAYKLSLKTEMMLF